MEYRQLGETGIYFSALTFGAWAIGTGAVGDADPANAAAALHKAHELGFTTIDTAPLYGFGYTEAFVGDVIRDFPRDKIQLITKCGVVWEGNKGMLWYPDKTVHGRNADIYRYSGCDSIIRECENSLRRLKTDYIDLYAIHWPDPTTPVEASMEAFIRLKEQGKIRAAGLANRSLEEMKRANDVIDVASNKVRYSMINRRVEKDLAPWCVEHHKSILAYQVLQRGLLTGRDVPRFVWAKDDTPAELALYEPHNIRHIRSFLQKLEPIAAGYGGNITQLCIRWLVNRPGVTVGLLAATSPEQVVHDAFAMNMNLSQTDAALIDELVNELAITLELPEGIPLVLK